MSRVALQLSADHVSGGYHHDTRNRAPEQVTFPSRNLRYTEEFGASTRLGYDSQDLDLSSAGNRADAFYVKQYNLVFFSVGTTLQYEDRNKGTIVDTGITLTDNSDSSMGEYNNDLYYGNPVDGWHRIIITRLAQDIAIGNDIIVDQDGAARLAAYGLSSDNVRIAGTNEAYTAITIATGTLTAASSAVYSTDDVAVIVQAVAIPKGNKIEFWKEGMYISGLKENQATASGEIPQTTLYYSAFTISLSPNNIIDFTTTSKGAGSQPIGKNGEIITTLATKDVFYIFKKDETYSINASAVSPVDGARFPDLFSKQYGCANKHCVAIMNGFAVWLTNNKRIIRSNIRIEGGSTALFEDESFDRPLKTLLDKMDDDQSEARVWYQGKAKELHVKCKIDGEILELVYDNNLGVWCPPDTNKQFHSYYEIDGEPYATSDNDDTVYKLDEGFSDDGGDIDWVIALGRLDANGVTDWGKIVLDIDVARGTSFDFVPVNERGEGTKKVYNNTNDKFKQLDSIGDFVLGASPLAGSAIDDGVSEDRIRYWISPAKTRQMQPVLSGVGDGNRITLKKWALEDAKTETRYLTTSR